MSGVLPTASSTLAEIFIIRSLSSLLTIELGNSLRP
jgi:hypothetical protein